jgi:hypothetical protein
MNRMPYRNCYHGYNWNHELANMSAAFMGLACTSVGGNGGGALDSLVAAASAVERDNERDNELAELREAVQSLSEENYHLREELRALKQLYGVDAESEYDLVDFNAIANSQTAAGEGGPRKKSKTRRVNDDDVWPEICQRVRSLPDINTLGMLDNVQKFWAHLRSDPNIPIGEVKQLHHLNGRIIKATGNEIIQRYERQHNLKPPPRRLGRLQRL